MTDMTSILAHGEFYFWDKIYMERNCGCHPICFCAINRENFLNWKREHTSIALRLFRIKLTATLYNTASTLDSIENLYLHIIKDFNQSVNSDNE